jgi:acyl CoA:acetate/3-ketoacid CoA transferase beta subunit
MCREGTLHEVRGPRLVRRCTYPLTGTARCDAVITERAVFRRAPGGGGFILEGIAARFSPKKIRACTDMDYEVSRTLRMAACGRPIS